MFSVPVGEHNGWAAVSVDTCGEDGTLDRLFRLATRIRWMCTGSAEVT